MAELKPVEKKQSSGSKSKGPLFALISRAISREGPQGIPEFPVKLHVVEDVPGEPVIYQEMPGQVLQRRPTEFVAQQILFYAMKQTKQFTFDANDAKNCAQFWRFYANRLTGEITPVSQATEIGYTFHRLPWDFKQDHCPTWDEMFSRMENANAVMAWIGSLFEAHSDRQQYVWIHGSGGDGKGSINRFLHRVFNGAYRSEVVPERGDKFWTSGLINARVVVFGDCNNFHFITKGIFKQITGDDPIKIEFKGENAFSTKLVCKLMFLSNERPDISGQRSDTRRAIFSEIAPIKGDVIPTKIYDQSLWKEGPAFLYKCLELYKTLCQDHGAIPVKQEIIDLLVADNEEELEMITLKNFEIEPELLEDQDPISENKRWFVLPSRLHTILDEMKIYGDRRRSYIEFLKRKFRVAKKAVKVDGEVVRRYLGIREATDRPCRNILGIPINT